MKKQKHRSKKQQAVANYASITTNAQQDDFNLHNNHHRNNDRPFSTPLSVGARKN
jgi:hypothetical protein